MTTTTFPFKALGLRIKQQQSALDKLLREFEARKTHLNRLSQRKEELLAQLHQVNAEIRAVARGKGRRRKASPNRRPRPAAPLKMADLLVNLVRKSRRPVTVRQMAEEVKRREFPSKSGNLPRLIQTRVQELLQQGILRRAPDQAGVLPGKFTNSNKPVSASKKKSPSRKPASRPSGPPQPPLRQVLTNILNKSQEPMTGGELAREVQKTGYRTTSKNFGSVVSIMLSRMDNITHVPGQGYRMKKP